MKNVFTKRRVVFLGVALVMLYLTKPDKGGSWACSKVFGLPELSTIDLDHKPFWTWKLFESFKYQFSISPEDFTKLQVMLADDGYSEWTEHGLQYGSVNIGWSMNDDFIVTKKQSKGMTYYWAYSRELNTVYAISWNN